MADYERLEDGASDRDSAANNAALSAADGAGSRLAAPPLPVETGDAFVAGGGGV